MLVFRVLIRFYVLTLNIVLLFYHFIRKLSMYICHKFKIQNSVYYIIFY